MSRASRSEPCIFCDKAPCECGGPVKKAQRKQPAPKVQDNRVKASILDEVTWAPPETNSTRFKTVEIEKTETTVDELELAQAIRNLEPILSSQMKRRYKDVLKKPVPMEIDRKLVEWRMRNGKG